MTDANAAADAVQTLFSAPRVPRASRRSPTEPAAT